MFGHSDAAKNSATNPTRTKPAPELGPLQERLLELPDLLRSVDKVIKENEDTVVAIERFYDKALADEKSRSLDNRSKAKLRGLYNAASQAAAAEEQEIRRALDVIYQIRAIRAENRHKTKNSEHQEILRRGALMMLLQSSARMLPLYVGRPGQEPPPLCGALPADPGYSSKSGDLVAALVKGSDGEENWILAEVLHFDRNAGKYEVEDIDEEQSEKHLISKRRVVPLPNMRADPETCPEGIYPEGATVYALYPQTTCFYRARIDRPPATALDEYMVLFEDPQYAEGLSPALPVTQRYIVSVRDKKSKP